MIVKVLDEVKSYDEAIKISCDILKERKSITENYYDAIMDKIDEFGPYFCMAPKLAMPHARPEDGAIENDFCLLKLNKPVDFLGKNIEIFLTLSAKDNTSHLEIMQQIAGICMNEEKLNKILNSKNENEIMEVM